MDAIILADSQTGLIVGVNNAGADLLGLPREKIIGMHQSKIHPPDKVEKYKKLFKEHTVKGTVLSEEMIIHHADGRQIPVEISTSIINLAGKPVIQGVFHDVTERNRMEKSLRGSEEKFSKAFHASP